MEKIYLQGLRATKGAHEPARLRSLFSAFVKRWPRREKTCLRWLTNNKGVDQSVVCVAL